MRTVGWLLLVAFFSPTVLAANDWAQFRYNETHQGAVPAADNTEFGPFTDSWWTGVTIAGPVGSPVLRDGLVYYGDNAGVIHAFDQESGGRVWSASTGSKISGAPAVGGDFVYVVNEGGQLYSFNRKTGTTQSGYPLSVGGTVGSILFHEDEDLLYVGTQGGQLGAYFATIHATKWTFNSVGTFFTNNTVTCGSGVIEGTPVIFGRFAFFGSTNKCFYAVDTTSFSNAVVSSPVWVFQALNSVRSTPAIDITNQRVVFGDSSGNVYALPLTGSGKVTASPVYTEPAQGGITAEIKAGVAMADGKAVVASRSGWVRALTASGSGTWPVAWSHNLNQQAVSSAAVANGHVLLGSFDRKMYMFTLGNGTLVNTWPAAHEIETSPAISGTQGFWGDKQGNLYSYGGKKPDRPDLVVESFSADSSSVYQGRSTTLTAVVVNRGVLASVGVTAVMSDGTQTIQTFNVGPLEPGASTSLSASYTPSTTGSVTLRVQVDTTRAQQESNESNNAATLAVEVATPPADDETGGDGGGGGDEEEGVPGFGLAAALIGLGLLVWRRRRA